MGEPGVRTSGVDVAPDFIAYCQAEGLTHQASGLRYAATTFTDPVDASDHVYVVPLDPEIDQRPDVLAGLMTRFTPSPLLVRTRPAATGPAEAGLTRSIAYLLLDHQPTVEARFRVHDADGGDDVAFVTDLLERSYTEGYAALGARAADHARDYVAELGVGTDALRSLVVTDDAGRRLGHLTAVEDMRDEVTELDCDEVVDVMFTEKPPSGAETSLVAAAVQRSIAAGRVLLGRVTYDHPRGPRIERKLLDDGWQPFYDVWSSRPAGLRATP